MQVDTWNEAIAGGELFEIIMVFNAQAGPFVVGGHKNTVRLCSIPLRAILSTP